MLRYIFWAFAIYAGYKLLFDIILPIYRTSKKIRKQFGAMQDQVQDHMNTQANNNSFNTKKTDTAQKTTSKGDYIDFEEVK